MSFSKIVFEARERRRGGEILRAAGWANHPGASVGARWDLSVVIWKVRLSRAFRGSWPVLICCYVRRELPLDCEVKDKIRTGATEILFGGEGEPDSQRV